MYIRNFMASSFASSTSSCRRNALQINRLSADSKGFTLIETIIIIVVISVVAVALFGVFGYSTARSANPMLQVQAIAIAQGYLDEVLLKAATDPDSVETNSCEEGAAPADRPNYDDVWDYHDICTNDTDGARDQFGTVMAELDDYDVDVQVTSRNFSGQTMLQVDVTVTHDSNTAVNVRLVGYRANYP